MQRRIERTFGKVERSVAAGAKLLRNRIAVRWLGLNSGEEEQVEVALDARAWTTTAAIAASSPKVKDSLRIVCAILALSGR